MAVVFPGGPERVLQVLHLGLAVFERLREVVDLEDVLVPEDGLVPGEHVLVRHGVNRASTTT
jgi:hypothetical protein